MGEAKVKRSQEETSLLAMVSIPVTEDDILVGAACICLLGDFWPQPQPPADAPAEEQLRRYWSRMRRALKVEKVPAVWNRIRCLTEAMAKNDDVRAAFQAEERGDQGVFYDIQSMVFRRVCATMPIMPNREGARSITANVYCPHDVILSLAHGPT